MSERNVAAETGTLALTAWGDSIKRDIHAALDRYSCPECGGWDGMVVVFPYPGQKIATPIYVNETSHAGSFFEPCDVCNRRGEIPDGFTIREVA